MTVIDPAGAIAIARLKMGQPDARARVSENADGYLVSFDRVDAGRAVATMTSAWVWIDKTTGDANLVGSGLVSRLADSLRPLDL
jgi:hypothetical protein